MAEPDFTSHLLEQPLEPRAVATGLQAHDDRSSKLLVEAPHRSFVLVLQFQSDEFASFSFQITDRLLPCMKVNADIYCLHSASFQSPIKESREFTTHGEGRRLLHNITKQDEGRSHRDFLFDFVDCIWSWLT